MHSKHDTDFWDTHAENIFAVSGIDNVLKDCVYFENIYTQHQFINLFGVIAIRLFFNVTKKHLLLTKFFGQEKFYRFFVNESRLLFTNVCESLFLDYIQFALRNFKPWID